MPRRGGRKPALGTRAPPVLPDGPNQRWSLDFVSDTLTCSRRFRILAWSTTSLLALLADHGRLDEAGGRYRADLVGHLALVAGAAGQVALDRSRQADAERLFVLVRRFAECTGYTKKAIYRQIADGV